MWGKGQGVVYEVMMDPNQEPIINNSTNNEWSDVLET